MRIEERVKRKGELRGEGRGRMGEQQFLASIMYDCYKYIYIYMHTNNGLRVEKFT